MKKKLPLLLLALPLSSCLPKEPVLNFCAIDKDIQGAHCAKNGIATPDKKYEDLDGKDGPYICVSPSDYLLGRNYIDELKSELAKCQAK